MLIFLVLVHRCCVCRVTLLQSTRSVLQGLVPPEDNDGDNSNNDNNTKTGWAGTSGTVMGQIGSMGVAPEGPCSPLVCWGGAAASSSWGA
jgi:hypothetical protein